MADRIDKKLLVDRVPERSGKDGALAGEIVEDTLEDI
jgi:hypothetical protein